MLQPSPSTQVAVLPITESAVALRVHMANWPAGLNLGDTGVAAVRRAFDAAGIAYNELLAKKKELEGNPSLTTVGKFEALTAWGKQKIAVLQKLAADVDERSATFEQTRAKNVMAALGPPPTSNEEIEHLREVRDWLRSKPEAERQREVYKAAERGDRAVLRAVLRAPTPALIDMKPDLLTHIIDASYAGLVPEKAATHESARKALSVTACALDGVIRLIEAEIDPRTKARSRAVTESVKSA